MVVNSAYKITKSQNVFLEKTAENHLGQLILQQKLVQLDFNISSIESSLIFLRNALHSLTTLTVIRFLLQCKLHSLRFYFFPLPLLSSLGATKKYLAPSLLPSLAPCTIDEISKNLPQPRKPSLFQLSPCDRCFNPSVMFVAFHWICTSYVHISFVLGSPELEPALQLCPISAEQKERITSFDLLSTLFVMQTVLAWICHFRQLIRKYFTKLKRKICKTNGYSCK